MKRLSTLSVLLLAITFIASAGCARWTLLPKSSNSPATPGAAPQANGAAQGQAANRTTPQDTGADLKTLDPALAIARLTERQGEPSEARRQYLRYMEKHPEHPLPHHRLGVMAARETKYDEAEAHFQAAARLAPPSAELLSDYGYLYYLQSRLPEAEQLMREASRMEPSNQTYGNNLALVMGALGHFDESMRQFRQVNEEGEARANLAYTLSQHGELDHARKEYLHALTLDNKLNNAAKALLQVEEARKREQLAIARRKEALGDELLEAQAPGASQPVEPQPRQRMPTLELSQQQQPQRPTTEPTHVATRHVAAQPVATQSRWETQANSLMPVPTATSEVAIQPTPRQVAATPWQEPYEVAELPAARPMPLDSQVQPASFVAPIDTTLSTPSFGTESTSSASAATAPQDGFQSAWQQLSQPSPSTAAQPKTVERKSGYSISLGDK